MKTIVPRLIGIYLNVLSVFAPRLAGRKGFNLFCTPRSAPLKDHQNKFLDTAEGSRFWHGGAWVQTYRWGNGPQKILFLHGWQSHTYRWRNYIESFPQDEFTIYALDAPAHGRSGGKRLSLPAYSDVIESFLYSIEPVHTIVSHSMGSFAALYTLHRVPQIDIQQLVIMGSPGEAEDFTSSFRSVLGLSDRAMRFIYDAFERIVQHPPSYYSAARFASSIKLPMLVIHDEHDDEAPFRHALKVHKAVEGSELITTNGLGHNLRSAKVVDHVVNFTTRQRQFASWKPNVVEPTSEHQ
jgi:pimeloyl-ACP methyl ester carboxylesterase